MIDGRWYKYPIVEIGKKEPLTAEWKNIRASEKVNFDKSALALTTWFNSANNRLYAVDYVYIFINSFEFKTDNSFVRKAKDSQHDECNYCCCFIGFLKSVSLEPCGLYSIILYSIIKN